MTDVTAKSGSATDIQSAVNTCIASQTPPFNVFIPEGDWACDEIIGGAVKIDLSQLPGGAWLNIIGSHTKVTALTNFGDPKSMYATILRSSVGSHGSGFFYITGTANKHLRFTGISLLGVVGEPLMHNFTTIGIFFRQVDVFRTDHCFFDSFSDEGVGGWASKGLIDHCDFDNTFAEHQSVPPNEVPDGYGVAVFGNSQFGGVWADINSLLGKWDTGLDYTYGPVYIEDCSFRMCRHAIASAQHAWYVTRHCKYGIGRSDGMGNVDVHGVGPGGRGLEAYDNDLGGNSPAFWIRGGGGVITRNYIHDTNVAFMLAHEDPGSYEQVSDLWIWGNNVVNTAMYSFPTDYKPVEGVDFFTTERAGYTPFTYPHPLASEVSPENVTPLTIILEPGTYRITMPLNVLAGTDTYTFLQWEDGSTNPERLINLLSDMTITATYKPPAPPPPPQYVLTISTATVGGTTNPASGSYSYDEDTSVEVSALPSSGYSFDHWVLDGANAGSTNPISLVMDADHSLQAVFALVPPVQYTLTIASEEGGTTTPVPGNYLYNTGTSVEVSAAPASGYNFNHWLLDGVSYSTNPIVIVMTGNRALTAYFSTVPPPPPTRYKLNLATTIGGSTVPTPGIIEYDAGATVTVAAVPNTGYDFTRWELDGISSTQNPITVVMDKDHMLLAVFTTTPPPPPEPTHTLAITSAPVTGVPIQVDGTSYSTPTPPITLQEGTHIVECPANVQSGNDIYNFQQWEDGSVNVKRTITLTTDTTIMASYVLVAPPPEKAYVAVYAFLDDVEIVADGLVVDTNQPFQTRATLEVTPGTYTIRVTYQDQTQEKSVTVEADQTIRVDFQFTSAAPPSPPVQLWKVAAASLGILAVVGIMVLG